MIPPLTIIDVQREADDIRSFKNIPIALINDHIVRLSVMTDTFYWHYHPNSDEIFLTIEGVVYIDLEDRTVELAADNCFPFLRLSGTEHGLRVAVPLT
jgi:mannose-6-phosphate isomerase-like protein (cupin superfamily)